MKIGDFKKENSNCVEFPIPTIGLVLVSTYQGYAKKVVNLYSSKTCFFLLSLTGVQRFLELLPTSNKTLSIYKSK